MTIECTTLKEFANYLPVYIYVATILNETLMARAIYRGTVDKGEGHCFAVVDSLPLTWNNYTKNHEIVSVLLTDNSKTDNL